MLRCARCRRLVMHPVYFGGSAYGSHCARAVGGVKPKRRARAAAPVDQRQAELFHVEAQPC